MFFPNGDGTYTAGLADIILILQDQNTQRFHVCLFEEYPMPGPYAPILEQKFIRLKSKGHHTEGADTLEGAKVHI